MGRWSPGSRSVRLPVAPGSIASSVAAVGTTTIRRGCARRTVTGTRDRTVTTTWDFAARAGHARVCRATARQRVHRPSPPGGYAAHHRAPGDDHPSPVGSSENSRRPHRIGGLWRDRTRRALTRAGASSLNPHALRTRARRGLSGQKIPQMSRAQRNPKLSSRSDRVSPPRSDARTLDGSP